MGQEREEGILSHNLRFFEAWFAMSLTLRNGIWDAAVNTVIGGEEGSLLKGMQRTCIALQNRLDPRGFRKNAVISGR